MLISPQQSEQWFKDRLGKVTASRLNDVVSRLKNGDESSARANYKSQLICERLTGQIKDQFSTQDMRWGAECEAFARSSYEVEKGTIIEQIGFVPHPSIEMCGASPDGIVCDGTIEIKCLTTKNHIDVLLTQKVPDEFINQIQWQMACTNKNWCDFVAFDPRLPEPLQMFIQRIERDNDKIKQLEEETIIFLCEIDEKINKLKNMYSF